MTTPYPPTDPLCDIFLSHPSTQEIWSNTSSPSWFGRFWHGLKPGDDLRRIFYRNGSLSARLTEAVAGEACRFLDFEVIDGESIGISSPRDIIDPTELRHILECQED